MGKYKIEVGLEMITGRASPNDQSASVYENLVCIIGDVSDSRRHYCIIITLRRYGRRVDIVYARAKIVPSPANDRSNLISFGTKGFYDS